MATRTQEEQLAHTQKQGCVSSDSKDFTCDTTADGATHILSLTSGLNEEDIDSDDNENEQDLRPLSNEEYNNEQESDNETDLAAMGNKNASAGTPRLSEPMTPPPNVATKRKQKLVLKMPKRSAAPPSDSFATQAPTTSKSSRRKKARKTQDDTLMGLEYNGYFAAIEGKGANTGDNDYMPSSPPVRRNLTHPPEPDFIPPAPVEELSSSTLGEEEEPADVPNQGLSGDSDPANHPFFASISLDIHKIVSKLAAEVDVRANLPYGSTGDWTAEELTHLYISAYQSQNWNICDLVTDTWIRAFQNLNKTTPIWRANKSGYLYTPKSTDTFGLQEFDPPLEPQICAFEARLLNNLYHHTDKQCGARMLWADAMALVGAEWEAEITSHARRHNKWHPDLIYNVMCTALRMVRRKLTLKVEESTEGAWCKRYHMHTLFDEPCYQEMAQDPALVASGGRKRRAEEMEDDDDDDVEEPRKRVAFGGGSDSEEK